MTTSADRSPLEEQIAQWRLYLRRRRAIHGPDVEELEGHLRDQMAVLTEAGLAGDEAFLVAVKRLGSLERCLGTHAALGVWSVGHRSRSCR
jgi:hypothetical protein